MNKAAIAIHGGAGAITRAAMSPQQENHYRAALQLILQSVQRLLAAGGSALDAVTEAVRQLEECPLFNAGKGAVFTHEGTHELDASIMEGKHLEAGAVAGVWHIRNPILAARAVMEQSPHLLLIGSGAEIFAREKGMTMVENSFFSTPERWAQLQQAREAEVVQLDHADLLPTDPANKMGTVGAVALDREGNLAAATSTGGMTNKRAGRVGDSPLIGAGCYADNNTAAVSCTGTGEAFIRLSAAYDISAMMAYGGLTLQQACELLVNEKLPALGGTGGLIAIDRAGNLALPFNSEGMYRGYAYVGSEPVVAIYRAS